MGKYFFFSFVCTDKLGQIGWGNYSIYLDNKVFSLKRAAKITGENNVVIVSYQEINKLQFDKFHQEYDI